MKAFITHPDCLRHAMGPGHPERPQRLTAIEEALRSEGLWEALLHLEAPLASREHLTRVHDPAYVEAIFATAPKGGMAVLDPDTAMNPYSLTAALRAAGAAVLGVEKVLAGDVASAFCSVRPPGHHAERDKAMGFCIFNNAAVGAAHALALGLGRVAICDFDVHHGNGTEDIFRDEPRVLLCSTFQHPFYPFRGADTVSDHIVNVPLPAGTGSQGFREAVEARWLPALEAFRPELMLCSAGFDAHRDDPLGGLRLTEEDYAWVTEAIAPFAGRGMVSVLEGGYHLKALGASACAHIRALP